MRHCSPRASRRQPQGTCTRHSVSIADAFALDNEGCEAFMEGTAAPSRMRHVDCSQQWVAEVRDEELFAPFHAASALNLSDIPTKFFESKKDFTDIRDQLMARRSFAA